jgi:hypothetical protein
MKMLTVAMTVLALCLFTQFDAGAQVPVTDSQRMFDNASAAFSRAYQAYGQWYAKRNDNELRSRMQAAYADAASQLALFVNKYGNGSDPGTAINYYLVGYYSEIAGNYKSAETWYEACSHLPAVNDTAARVPEGAVSSLLKSRLVAVKLAQKPRGWSISSTGTGAIISQSLLDALQRK